MTDSGEFTRAGRVRFGGLEREVNLALVPEAVPGDYVLVHVGLALSRVDEAEATRTLDYLRQIDELGELRGPVSPLHPGPSPGGPEPTPPPPPPPTP